MTAPIAEIAGRYGLRRSGSRYIGACPKCGGSERTDRFVLFADGGFKCFSCDFAGDQVKWLRETEGMSCKEAHDALGKRCSTSCPNYGPCREGKRVPKVLRSVAVPARLPQSRQVPDLQSRESAPVWQAWAESLLQGARATLAQLPEELAWLAGRGIPAAAVDRFGLGWLAHDLRVPVQEMGLPVVDGRDRRWVPGGLVIPVRTRSGNLHRLRIRRTPASRAKFLQERKYEWVKGSGNDPMVLGDPATARGLVVVEAELDAIACAAAHPEVMVVALGSVQYGLPPWLRSMCAAAAVVLVALDADAGPDGAAGAGPQAVQRWQASFRQARFWPVPAGKDPGDYFRDHGGDLRAWIEAGLPPKVVKIAAPAADQQDASFSPGQYPAGGKGGGKRAEKLEVAEASGDDLSPVAEVVPVAAEDVEKEEQGPVARIMTLKDGREVQLTDDRDLWMELAVPGQRVFSGAELGRVNEATAGMSPEEKQAAIDAVLMVKEVFGSAYITAGRALNS